MLIEGPSGMGFREMSESRLSTYLAALPDVAARLGGRQLLWRIEEIASESPNRVFIVEGPGGDVCVKQALPQSRLGSDSWPLPPERATFEEAALTLHGRFAPGLVPRIIHYDSELFLIVMERLHPHVVLRDGLIQGKTYPRFVDQIARFMAQTLFFTSDLGMPTAEKKERVAFFCGNIEAGRLNEQLIFTEPFTGSRHNRWTSPQLDGIAAEIRADAELKRAISALKLRFMAELQALVHGDLHTGSVMVTPTDTKVIDLEFATFGPMGFDLGRLAGSLLMAYFSQDGHARPDALRATSERWLLEAIEQVWQGFHDRFVALWRSARTGDAYPEALFEGAGGTDSLQEAQRDYMRRLFEDTLRFAGANIIRRVLGRQHQPDFQRIEDPDRRAVCERRALVLARELVKDAHFVTDMAEVAAVAKAIRSGEIPSD